MKLKVKNGEFVGVTSRRGKIKAKAQVTEKSGEGEPFMSFNFHEVAANLLTDAALDKISECKLYTVTIRKTS